MSTPLIVTATLDTACVGLVGRDVMLDGPLAWAAAMAARASGRSIEPITRDCAPDLDLPLERWQEAGTWGWCTSRGVFEVASRSATEIRRKPATGAMARFTTAPKHHSGLGPYKARDTIIATEWVTTATWHVLATDQGELEALLALITHLGAHQARGMGHVAEWSVTPDSDPDGWRDRPMPTPGIAASHRAPYWHPRRRVAS